jgi:hypothetical protein
LTLRVGLEAVGVVVVAVVVGQQQTHLQPQSRLQWLSPPRMPTRQAAIVRRTPILALRTAIPVLENEGGSFVNEGMAEHGQDKRAVFHT